MGRGTPPNHIGAASRECVLYFEQAFNKILSVYLFTRTISLILVLVFLGSCTSAIGKKDKSGSDSTITESEKTQETSGLIEAEAQEVGGAVGEANANTSLTPKALSGSDLVNACINELSEIPGSAGRSSINAICETVRLLSDCESAEGRPIFHMDEKGIHKKGKRILVMGYVHGDEHESGLVARSWMARLLEIESRNTWRVIPVLNPDGRRLNTRTNARKVDINRNFPSSDWNDLALKYWKSKAHSSQRRYPGPTAASEPETRCAIHQIRDFKPDLIIAIHTPLGVLDFDGPKLAFPKYTNLPWIRLGHFPGSLGRYMWKDHKTPVMTIELKPNQSERELSKLDDLQDLSGIVAIMTNSEDKQVPPPDFEE
ncbi:MAG: hypothetical protein COT74_13675 [Bdellovibrionales bacterium CG10_big_fil_rev_8_21_14_0_10_45_34]|nr:MAG: hypothetical protein COT74_13675 [Bdellovibrionales bacterium CG10_big_fil_rev_8_21_14_0_10_45_34]